MPKKAKFVNLEKKYNVRNVENHIEHDLEVMAESFSPTKSKIMYDESIPREERDLIRDENLRKAMSGHIEI